MRIVLFPLTVLFSVICFAQTTAPYPKYGKITVVDLQKKVYDIDSHAKAVVLQDVGSVSIEGNSKGWFSLVTNRHRVVHILDKSGYDLANVEIPLFRNNSGDEERIISIKATTYNLENGKIVETKMEKSSIFNENVTKYKSLRKFTMPNVKEGCIIEYEYKVMSDYIRDLDPWIFQESVPVVWSDFEFEVPSFFIYTPQLKGYIPVSFTDRKDAVQHFSIRDNNSAGASSNTNFSANSTKFRWVMKNVPALVEESFTSSINNHISRMEFQLMGYAQPLTPKSFMRNWAELTKLLLDSDAFGSGLKTASWVTEEYKPTFASVKDEEEKARKIFYHLRDNFSVTGSSGLNLTESFKNLMKTKKGSVTDVNLLLAGILSYHGLDASPVILSTTSNGYVYDFYPNLRSFNYVIVLLKINEKSYYLDASKPLLGFNQLLPYCYNGFARVISHIPAQVELDASNLKENSNTMVIIVNDEKGKWVGKISRTHGNYGSYRLRDKIKEKGKEAYFTELEKTFGMEVEIKDPQIDSLTKYDFPVKLHYDIALNTNDAGLIYINPMFNEGVKKNPFTSLTRSYPVEMPYAFDDMYILNMEVPAGYVVDEMPKQMLAKLDEEGKSFFEYRISQSGSIISFRSRLKIDKAIFLPEDYEILREFYSLVVQKHNEQIVLKKK